ncbi:hypothetical protein ACP275_01G063700 [Erythranthe tilingii]
MKTTTTPPPLHSQRPLRRRHFNRLFAAAYTAAILSLLYHHTLTLLHSTTTTVSLSVSLLLFLANAILAYMWSTAQSFRMNPVHRRSFPENLQNSLRRKDFPAVDIFICTADPHKEPPVGVANTALSVMAYDYPTEKLSVYVSDDGGSELTAFAFMEAAKFGKVWLPFCRENDVTDTCPDAYFASNYALTDKSLEIKLRVSASMTNSPIILTLDCDMYSNDPLTVQRVLCYLAVNSGNPNCGYIQFPQRYHGLNKSDIYASEHKRLFLANPIGMDGLNGPNYVGTGCFFRRRVFFGGPFSYIDPENRDLDPNHIVDKPINSKEVLGLAHHFASCNYENQTNWGSKLGFRYGSLVEDYYTGYRLQCEGWRSVFCDPKRPAFLGDVPISLNDVLSQTKRWSIGLLEVSFSKYSPITFGVKAMGILMAQAYAHYAFWPVWSIPITIYAFAPSLALLLGIPIFPKFSLYAFLFLGAYVQDCLDFISARGTFQRWWSDQRLWLIRGLSSFLFGSIEYTSKRLGMATHGFNVTSKVMDNEQSKRYNQGMFEFGVASPMFVPLAMAAILNLAAFLGGFVLVLKEGGFDRFFMQIFIAGFGVLNSLPFYEAMVLRSDKGKMPMKTTITSILLVGILYGICLLCTIVK